MKSKSILRLFLITAFILLIPLIAMQFTSEVMWTLSDFVIAGVLIMGTGLVYEFASARITIPAHKLLFGIGLLFIFVLVWADLAVGIFNIPGFSGS